MGEYFGIFFCRSSESSSGGSSFVALVGMLFSPRQVTGVNPAASQSAAGELGHAPMIRRLDPCEAATAWGRGKETAPARGVAPRPLACGDCAKGEWHDSRTRQPKTSSKRTVLIPRRERKKRPVLACLILSGPI
jgi:hypothetical protein